MLPLNTIGAVACPKNVILPCPVAVITSSALAFALNLTTPLASVVKLMFAVAVPPGFLSPVALAVKTTSPSIHLLVFYRH